MDQPGPSRKACRASSQVWEMTAKGERPTWRIVTECQEEDTKGAVSLLQRWNKMKSWDAAVSGINALCCLCCFLQCPHSPSPELCCWLFQTVRYFLTKARPFPLQAFLVRRSRQNLLQIVLFVHRFLWKLDDNELQKLEISLSSDFIRPIPDTDHSMTSDLHEPPPCHLYNIIIEFIIIIIIIIIIVQKSFSSSRKFIARVHCDLDICFEYTFWLVRFELFWQVPQTLRLDSFLFEFCHFCAFITY